MLDDLDSLFDEDVDTRDRFAKLLSNLGSRGEHLKLLVTSEQSLLGDTNERFRQGSEKVRCGFPAFSFSGMGDRRGLNIFFASPFVHWPRIYFEAEHRCSIT